MGNENVAKLCGLAKGALPEVLRPGTFVLTVPCKEGVLWYHTLTGELLLLAPEEAETDGNTREYLYRHHFLVPEEFDENRFTDQIRHVLRLMQPRQGHITSYRIFTTTDCNARCYYCYEQGVRCISMTDRVARDTAAFIAAQCGGEEVSLQWFGGEPLLRAGAIDIMTDALRERGVSWHASMISNGYLFDRDMVRRAKESWRLGMVQITLDGTEQVYNRTKAYINGGRNPYRVVLENIGALLEREIRVNLRLNMNRENREDMFRLAQELAEDFGGKKGLSVYGAVLYDYVPGGNGFASPKEALDARIALTDCLERLQLAEKRGIDGEFRVHQCMADNDSCITVLPDGKLGKCEHFIESGFVGTVYDGITDLEEVNRWKVRRAPTEACGTCAAYPFCSAELRNCPSNQYCCDEERKQGYLDLLCRKIRNTYDTERRETDETEA